MRGKLVRFAVVGLGNIGKRHAKIIMDNPWAELVAVCDVLDPSSIGWYNSEVPFFHSIEELIRSCQGIDVVNVCTPNGFHAPHSILALQAGKHVVIEKPMALSRSEAMKIIQVSEQVCRNVFVVKQNRYSPPVKWLKQLITGNILGRIFMVQMNCFWNRDDRYYKPGGWHGTANLDGGVLFTQFSHFLDIMHWLFGDIDNIRGNFRNFAHNHSTQFEDAGSILFDFKNGGMGSLNYSTAVWDKNLESSIIVIAERGAVKVAGQYMDQVSYCHVRDYTMPELDPVNPPNDYGAYKGSASNHEAVIQNVVSTINGEAKVATSAEEGMKVVDIIERVYQLRDNQETF